MKARYLQFGFTPDVVPSADGHRIPAVIKGVLDKAHVVTIVDIGHRRDVYRA